MKARRVLLISPAFHAYWASVARALEANGFDVRPFVYDDYATVGAKARNKLRYELPGRVGSGAGERLRAVEATRRARAALADSGADAVIAIRSDLFEQSLWDDIDDRQLPCILWLYDEVRRMSHSIDALRRFSIVATYSKLDEAYLVSNGVAARYLANAYDPTIDPLPVRSPTIVFIGARYPERERTIVRLHRDGVPVRVYGRQWSHHPYDRMRTWQWHRPALPASRDIPRDEAYALMAGAAATLNLHENQDGFTMRTFEACGVGALQLIDRSDVDELYEPGEQIVPFGSPEELEELCRRAIDDPLWGQRIGNAARKRTLAQHTFTHRMEDLTQSWA